MSGPTNATREDGTRYYRGGCAKGMPRVGACRLDCRHRALVEDYRASWHAWDEARGSDRIAPTSVPGAAGSLATMSNLDDETYDQANPAPRFRDFLIAAAGERE